MKLLFFFVGLPTYLDPDLKQQCTNFLSFSEPERRLGSTRVPAMPSLRELAHYGVLCTVHLLIDQPQDGVSGA
jgi:hypothetical protein